MNSSLLSRGLLVFFLLVAGVSSANSQDQLTTKSKKAAKLYVDGTRQYELLNYSNAIAMLDEATRADSRFIEAWIVLGQVYADMGNSDKALESWNKALLINPDFYPLLYLNIGSMLFSMGSYKDAKTHLEMFLAYRYGRTENWVRAEKIIRDCEFSIKAMQNPVPFSPISMGPSINTELDEYWPSLSADERVLVFTRLLPKNPDDPKIFRNRQEDFFISVKENGEWGMARNFGPPVNSSDNEGAQTLSTDSRVMFYTACNRSDGMGMCDIYFSTREGDRWSAPKNLGSAINTQFSEKQPSLSPDGKTLYFSSDRPGGKGAMDIWKTNRDENGIWSKPQNLGDSINTPYDEQSPFIHHDNQTLYFSSKGWPGLGRSDIYVTRRKEDGGWSSPLNLGYPINSRFDDEGLIVNARGTKAMFSTNRLGGNGRDIHEFDLHAGVQPNPVSYVQGIIRDAETLGPITAAVELIELNSARVIMSARSDTQSGDFLICLPVGQDYALNVNKEKYLFHSENFSLKEFNTATDPYSLEVLLQPVKPGKRVVLRNVFYAFDSYELLDQSIAELEILRKFMLDNPNLSIRVTGHTDNVGASPYNLQLSAKRAESVINYLIGKGIGASRLVSEGKGDTEPIASNLTEEGRAKNRRTEFVVE
jgi:outer membrane protein OmpA-like peptidoglycan-associated protein